MLILTRKVDQGIIISGNIWVRVLGVDRDRVKIGIDAPLDVTVLRQELLERDGERWNEKKNDRSGDGGDQAPSGIATDGEPAANES